MQIADRLGNIPPYLFMELRNKIAQARAEGIDVISLAIGDPVDPTPTPIIDELCKEAHNPANHRYPTDEEKGMLAFRQVVADWYGKRYGVTINPQNEVLALIGSKEGCHHFVLAVVNPGDVVLMTDPGYPAYRASILMGGGEPYNIPLKTENDFLPRFEDVPSSVARRATAIFLNYPNNPTGAVANPLFFAQVVEFARSYGIAVCHDNPYSEIVFEGEKPLSFLATEGAKEVGIELNSLSKPFNMTGWRIGMVLGNPDLIAGVSKVKENTDSGIFNAIQYAGIKALKECEDDISRMIEVYARRRKQVVDTFRGLGWDYLPPKGTFYLWLPTPEGISSLELTTQLFEKSRVVVAAGNAYGQCGEGYIRISLTVPDDRLTEAMDRIRKALS
ncbi:MAG: LL-diaminopimelate aminotransferase [Candidatus Binatia bacterium]